MKIKYPDLKFIVKRILICLLLISVGWYLKGRLSPSGGMGMYGMGEVYILAQKAQNKDIAAFNNKISYIEAINEVNLLPQISGTVENILFDEGSIVKEGDVLFEIDPSKYHAAYDLAKAKLDSAKANLVKAERDYNRQLKLSDEKFSSKATFDTAESVYFQAKAAVEEAKANLDLATIDLDNTQVRAPISGKIGKALVTKGNYVVTSQVTLAKIVQMNPVRISFSLTDKEYAAVKIRNYKKDNLTARITLANGDIITEKVVGMFLDNSINTNTATLSVYADVANEENNLIPGNYVQSAISDDKPIYAVVVPQTAINYDKDGAFVYIAKINPEKSSENDIHGVAEQRRVILGETIDSEQVVINGLSEGEMVIVQGNIKIQNNSQIKIGILEKQP
ncbi:MAG: efflux RND transporter periplasmic adaptor subunit [Alphaproteobacteria bacterium]|nr:efflux RND transporter periplasmic adaptor subunit [Alphaproteobacteria bacterium]